MRWLSALCQILPLAALLGCGGDERGPGGGPALVPGAYDEAADFPRDGCDAAPALAADELVGIWNLDLGPLDGRRTTGALRLDPTGSAGDGAGLAALLGGAPADATVDGDLVVRAVDEARGRLAALHACAAPGPDLLVGHLATCVGDACEVALARLHRVHALDEPEAVGLTLRGELGPAKAGWPLDPRHRTVDLRVHGTVAYLARAGDGLRIVDLADPADPRELAHVPVARPDDEAWSDVEIALGPGDRPYALVASDLHGVLVFDVSDPTDPYPVARFPGGGGAIVDTLTVVDGRAYLADGGIRGLRVFDVSEPRAPYEIGAYLDPASDGDDGESVLDLFVDDGVAYLGHQGLGLIVVDTRDMPSGPARVLGRAALDDRPRSRAVWATQAAGRRIVLHGDDGFGAHLRVLDDDPASADRFAVLASYATRDEVGLRDVRAAGEVGLLAYQQDGLRLVDLAVLAGGGDPAAGAVELGHFRTWTGVARGYGQGFAEGVSGVAHDAARGLILVADTHRGLLVLEPSPAIAARLGP
jgi:hypothetical protein